jgi:hypothetical protein
MELETPGKKEGRFDRLVRRLSKPVSAVAIDLFRIGGGLLILAYWIRLFREFPLYTSEDGILDHSLHRELFWFSKVTLFYPGSPPLYKWTLLIAGMLGTLMLLVGWRPKLGVAISWIVAVSVQRWNFAVINLDDSSIILILWWCLFLPIGHTLTYRTFTGRSNWREEAYLTVDGFFVRAYFGNLFIYYLTAGLTKLASPLWTDGLALYVVLNLPLSRTNGWWTPEHIPLLWVGNHLTTILEPLFPFLLFLRKGHPVKYLGGVTWVVFHLSILLSIGVPYANFGLINALFLVFHGEIGDLFRRKAGRDIVVGQVNWKAPRGTQKLIVAYLLILALAMQKKVPVLHAVYEPAMATLYLAGVAQEYHLFDWIDRFNWTISHQVKVTPEGKESFFVSSDELFEKSVRGFIVQSYLMPMRWMRVPRPLTGEMRNGILRRAAQRFVKVHPELLGQKGSVEIVSRIGRLDYDDLSGENLWPVALMTFRYQDGSVEFVQPHIPEVPQTGFNSRTSIVPDSP